MCRYSQHNGSSNCGTCSVGQRNGFYSQTKSATTNVTTGSTTTLDAYRYPVRTMNLQSASAVLVQSQLMDPSVCMRCNGDGADSTLPSFHFLDNGIPFHSRSLWLFLLIVLHLYVVATTDHMVTHSLQGLSSRCIFFGRSYLLSEEAGRVGNRRHHPSGIKPGGQ